MASETLPDTKVTSMKSLWTTLALCAAALPLHAQISYEKISVKAPFKMPEIQAPLFPSKDFDITQYGAKQGADITEFIAKAIDACHQAGGGRVVIPEGQWKTGKIHFKSNVNLHLAKDAELNFDPDPKAYLPAVQSSWEGFECFNYSSLIYAFQCENVAITGEGTLKADMSIWKKWMDRPAPHLEALKKLYHYTSANAPVEERQMAEGENNLRPPFIQFNRCKNVRIEGVKIRNSPFWTVHLYLSAHESRRYRRKRFGLCMKIKDLKATTHQRRAMRYETTCQRITTTARSLQLKR
ncbi:MAG: hypothetical protein QM680_12615 [Luteolibacter sp.]